MISFAYLFFVLLTYLIEFWISPGFLYEFNVVLIELWIYPGFLYEFNVVYVQREKSQYLLL